MSFFHVGEDDSRDDSDIGIIAGLNSDITKLQNEVKQLNKRIEFEKNKGILSAFASKEKVVENLSAVVDLELMGLQDIANSLPEKEREMILRRVRLIKNDFFRELFTIKQEKEKYLKERDE